MAKNKYIDQRFMPNGRTTLLSNKLNLKKYIEDVIQDGGLSGGIIDVTYSQLVSLIASNQLSQGSFYQITDFQTCYDRPDYDQFKTAIAVSEDSYFQGPNEPIIVLATSFNTLAPNAYQPTYPNDKIKYDVTYELTESGGEAFGRITERIDEFNNRTDYDYRNIEFKRYINYYYDNQNPQRGTIELLLDGTVNGSDGTLFTNYSVGQVIVIENPSPEFYKITQIDSDTLMTVQGLTITYTAPGKSFYIASEGGYDSYHRNNADDIIDFELYRTFDSSDNLNNYIGDYTIHYLEDGLGNFLLANNVLKSGEFNNNTIGNGSYNNTFNDDCTNNTIGNYFYNNITDDDFDGNVIGNYFNNNTITANFQYNQIGENFDSNIIINDDFYRNQIGNDFRDNRIEGGDFQNNVIGNQFNNNIIYVQFIKNRIANGFNQNIIHDNFDSNIIGNGYNNNFIYQQFTENTIGEYFYNNNIGDPNDIGVGSFKDNRIGNDFKDNTTLGQFEYNQIGNEFDSNLIDNYFYNNTIGNNFFSNSLSFNFAYNQIANSFSSNIIASDFGFGGSQRRGNVIGNDFQNNQIGEYFYDNNIKDSFSSNNIGNSFVNNNVSYNFNSNFIGNDFQNNDIKVSVVVTDFRNLQGQLTTVINVNSPNGVDNTYTNIPQDNTSGFGKSGTFDITVLGGAVNTVAVNNIGYGYAIGDTILINGSNFGGVNGVDDLTLSVNSATTTTYVTDATSCTISFDTNPSFILSYIDNLGVLNVVPITSQS